MPRNPKPAPFEPPRPVQTIVKLYQNACGGKIWTVLLENSLELTVDVLIALLGFGMSDVYRGFARPSIGKGRSGRHARKKGKKGAKFPKHGIPEIGNMIGRKLSNEEFEALKKATAVDGVRAIWVIDDVAQRILYWWLIYDIIDEFTLKWYTSLLKSDEARKNCPNELVVYSNKTGVSTAMGWAPCLFNDFVLENKGFEWNPDQDMAFNTNLGSYELWGYAEFDNPFPTAKIVQLRVVQDPALGGEVIGNRSKTIEPGETGKLVVTAAYSGQHEVQLQGRLIGGGPLIGTKGLCIVQQVGKAQ